MKKKVQMISLFFLQFAAIFRKPDLLRGQREQRYYDSVWPGCGRVCHQGQREDVQGVQQPAALPWLTHLPHQSEDLSYSRLSRSRHTPSSTVHGVPPGKQTPLLVRQEWTILRPALFQIWLVLKLGMYHFKCIILATNRLVYTNISTRSRFRVHTENNIIWDIGK